MVKMCPPDHHLHLSIHNITWFSQEKAKSQLESWAHLVTLIIIIITVVAAVDITTMMMGTITAIPSPNNPNGTSTPSQNANSSSLQAEHANNLDNGSPTGNSSGDLYNRPRSTSSNLSSSGGRCGADLIVPYIHSASHHHPHHSPYHHHHHHPHHHHHSSMASGYDTGVAPLIHPGAPPALSHA